VASHLLRASATDSIAAIKAGLPYQVFEDLAHELGVPGNVLARTISVPARTLQRRKQEGSFRADESDRLFRILRLSERAGEVLGASGAPWLREPKRFLGGRAPLDFADTEAGAWEIMQALGRLEHGVFL
jgi:putative toxin-antitoxin system antitoxin component (TIGR02293 family)